MPPSALPVVSRPPGGLPREAARHHEGTHRGTHRGTHEDSRHAGPVWGSRPDSRSRPFHLSSRGPGGPPPASPACCTGPAHRAVRPSTGPVHVEDAQRPTAAPAGHAAPHHVDKAIIHRGLPDNVIFLAGTSTTSRRRCWAQDGVGQDHGGQEGVDLKRSVILRSKRGAGWGISGV